MEADGGRFLVLSQALASNHHKTMGERAVGGEPLLSHKNLTDRVPRQEMLGFDLDTERMTISLPGNKINVLREMLQESPEERSKATVGEVLVLAGKLHHVADVIRPGFYFVRRLLQLCKLHLNGQEKRGGKGMLGKGLEEGRGREGVISDGKVHGGCDVVEVVSDGGRDRERGGVGGTVLPLRETASQKYLVFRRIIRGVRGAMPGDGGVSEVQPDGGRESEDG